MSQSASIPSEPGLLRLRELGVSFYGHPVVDGLSLDVDAGQCLCLVGESGSGKSMTALAIMGLVPQPGQISGQVLYRGQNLVGLDDKSYARIRGSRISMIFQEPMTSLNPVLRVGEQVMEPLLVHGKLSKKAAQAEAVHLLEQVGLPAPARRMHDFPHQLSGGMRQRVMIAMALACAPKLLLADEPTTALDVTVQGQILRLLRQLGVSRDMGLLLITHDLGVVAELADQVLVMYAGKLLEAAPSAAFFADTLHPYAQDLRQSSPTLANRHADLLPIVPGNVPSPAALPPGCAYAPRCAQARALCQTPPPLLSPAPNHQVRCWNYAH